MAIILNHGFDSRKFDYDAQRKGFITEASDIGFLATERIYDDACDHGIAIRSHLTGRLARFVLSSCDMDSSEEDVAGWRFTPIEEDCRTHPGLRGSWVLIIND